VLRPLLARTLLVLAAAVAALWLYGLGTGGAFYFKLARAPLAPAQAAPYYRESLLHVGLANLLGLTASILAFRLFVLAFWWSTLAVLVTAADRRLALVHTVLLVLVVLTHPSTMIVHAWTCHPDAVLSLLAAALLFTTRPWLVALLAALAAWTNLPMAVLLGLSLALLWRALGEPPRRTYALLLGLLAGALTCKLALHLAGVHILRDRLALARLQDPRALLHRWQAPGWPVLYTLHFAHLLWLPSLLLTLARLRTRRLALALVATQLIALAAAVFAEDTTRVFACLAWPPLVYCLLLALQSLAAQPDRLRLRPLVALAVVITLLAPKFYAWNGRLHHLDGPRAHLRALLP
jgi:hypothetical protein